MTRTLLLTLFGVACLLSAASANESACEKFTQTYDASNKAISASIVRGIGDDSAPRQANREMEMINERLQQLIVLQLMQAYECQFPTEASDGSAYLVPALECNLKRLTGHPDAPECERDNW